MEKQFEVPVSRITPGVSDSLSLPGKVFLMGEYAVLAGLPAWVAAVSPRFSASRSEGWKLRDPHGGRGGFGASSAEYAIRSLSKEASPVVSKDRILEVWRSYRADHEAQALPPSGADLIAQLLGGVARVSLDTRAHASAIENAEFERVAEPGASLPIAVFSATRIPGRKVRTHEHLSERFVLQAIRKGAFWTTLAPILVDFEIALSRGEAIGIGRAFSAYAHALSSMGLESPAARADREALESGFGVRGVKGTGALLSDAVLVAYDPSTEDVRRAYWYRTAIDRGLECLQPRLRLDEGWGA